MVPDPRIDKLADLNVNTLQDLLKYTPSVTYGNNGPGQGELFRS